jgi:aldose sugar dehydrogenase
MIKSLKLFSTPIFPIFLIVIFTLVDQPFFVYSLPSTIDSGFKIDKVYSASFKPSTMAFLGKDDFLVLDRDEGKVFRILNGKVLPQPVIDVNVATQGYMGLLGIAVSKGKDVTYVFLYFTESAGKDDSDSGKHPIDPLGNRLYRYQLVNNKLINPKLLLSLPAMPGPKDTGGVLKIGPDNNIYLTIGHLDGSFRDGRYETKTQNYQNSSLVDGRAGILVVSQEGKPVGKGILGSSFPLNLYYAYGIRNSFGIDWDPVTGYLWDSENGPHFGDEINLVKPGFNSGWAVVQGYWKPLNESIGPVVLHPSSLVDFNGHGHYSPPKFVWLNPAGPSAVKFINSTWYGPSYENDLLVGDANNGNIYDFKLDNKRENLLLKGNLADKIANDTSELNNIIFAKGFGKVADIKIGPDGLLYILSTQNHKSSVYRITS